MQSSRRGVHPANRRNFLDRHISVFPRQRMPLRIPDQDLRQWPHLHGLAIEARRLYPGIFLVRIPTSERRLGLALPRMQRFLALIVGMHHVFTYRFPEDLIRRRPESLHSTQIAVPNVSPGQVILRTSAVERQVWHREVISHSAADLEPLRIHRR